MRSGVLACLKRIFPLEIALPPAILDGIWRCGLVLILLSVKPISAASPPLPPAIQDPLRLGLPGNVVGAGFDAAGDLYLAGVTYGAFTEPAAAVPSLAATTTLGPVGGEADVYVVKIALSKSFPFFQSTPRVAYMTGIGSSGRDWPYGMAVDASGNVFVAGVTDSSDFPTTSGSFQPASATGGGFLLKLDPSGKKLVYSTYLDQGGTAIQALMVDDHGNAYVGGATNGKTFPTSEGAFQRSVSRLSNSYAEGYTVGFVSKFDASGKTLMLSTLVGGPTLSGHTGVTSIAADGSGVIRAGGSIGGAFGFPISYGSYSSNLQYPSDSGFLAALPASASRLLFSILLRGAPSVAKLDTAGNSYLLQNTYNQNTFIASLGLTKIDPTGTVVYDAPEVQGTSLVVLDDGTAAVAGTTESPNYVTKDTLQPCAPNLPQAEQPAFPYPNFPSGTFTTVGPSGSITFSTWLGGLDYTGLEAIALGPNGAFYLIGAPASSQFPGGPVIDASTGPAFILRLDLSLVPRGQPSPSCLASAATLSYAPVAPGGVSTLFGSNLGPRVGVPYQLDSNGRVSTELAGTTVTVGGIPAPILYAQDNQINFVVPQQLSGTTTNVCVTRGNEQSCIFAFVAQTWPAAFCISSCNTTRSVPSLLGETLAVLNEDGTLNAPNNPATHGSAITIFGTGMGPYDHSVPDGTIIEPPGPNLASPIKATFFIRCHIDPFRCVTPLFPGIVLQAGASPQQVAGVDRITIKIPDDSPQGPQVNVALESAAFPENEFGIFVAVK